jgi:hypothetical protein
MKAIGRMTRAVSENNDPRKARGKLSGTVRLLRAVVLCSLQRGSYYLLSPPSA